MNSTPHRRGHEDGGSGGSSNQSHPSALKYPQEDQGTYSGVGGKVVAQPRHDYHAPYEMAQEGRVAKIVPRNDLRDADRRSPLLPNMLFKVATPSDCAPENVGTDSRMEFRDPKDGIKDSKVEGRELKSESRDLQQVPRYDSRADDNKDPKHEGDAYAELKSNEKLDKDDYSGSNNQLNWKIFKEQRVKQYPDPPAGNSETWNMSTAVVHSSADVVKEGLHVENREFSEAHETVGENRIEIKGDDKLKDKDRRRKEVKNWEWGEKDKERSDRQNNLQLGNVSGEKKEVLREEREYERWGNEKKEPQKDKEKLIEKVKDHLRRELWNVSDREASLYDKELLEIPGKSEQDKSTLEPKKDHDVFKNIDREARDRKKERDADVESERSDKRSRYNGKESDEGSMQLHVEGGAEQEKELFNSGVQQRKRMLRHRGSPQMGNRDTRFRSGANDVEGLQSKTDVSCVYKIGECMQELIKLWKDYELSQVDKACESSQSGPTLEIRISAEHVTATNRQVRGGQLWGTDVYTVDSDLVAVLMHTGYCRPTASPPPSGTQELRATIRVLPPQECYISTLRNNVRSRAWGAKVGCSYRVERCCIVKKGGGIIELEPCLTHSSTMEPTLAPVAVERTMTTRAAASNALRQQRFVREVTIQFNLCMEPWLKYSISAVADKGLKKSLFTSARLKKGEVLYVETHSRRYELCFNGEKLTKTSTAPHTQGAETGKTQTYGSHLTNGERNTVDGESAVVDVFRWSRCKRPLPQKFMLRIGVPLPLEHVEVLEENLEWDDISWFQTGAWIAGKEYHLARAHFLSPN